ncbi:MAG: glycosyltransferase family 2 protein [Actinomycetota bacterium]|nr:glycosyltransferase family 2 protein [Actinomycetota bacterium]
MLVSVITITFNSKKYLEHTIQSVLDQDYSDIEYIIVDGGSTDGTLDIIRKYETRIAKWISEPDKGISDAWNKGIKMSSGEIIGLINSDDYYEPGALKAVADIFRENPAVDIIHGNLRLWNAMENSFAIEKPPSEPEKTAWRKKLAWHPTVFVRRRAYEKFGLFDLSYRFAMDYELILRFIKSGAGLFYIDRVLANMRTTGITNRFYRENDKEVRYICLKYGYNRLLVHGYYYWMALFPPIERNCGKFIKQLGLSFIITLYRKVFYPGVPKDY